MTVLRVYDPVDCTEHGVPLDWERCRTCHGTGCVIDIVNRDNVGRSYLPQPSYAEVPCRTCGGHGSLKAAALVECVTRNQWQEFGIEPKVIPPRCEGCGHPMSEGTWEWEAAEPAEPILGTELDDYAAEALRDGGEPSSLLGVHYSPCDEGCRHGGPGRWQNQGDPTWREAGDFHRDSDGVLRHVRAGSPVEASWRPVDVRLLGWPHDLRPEKLAVLCLRCWAARTKAQEALTR